MDYGPILVFISFASSTYNWLLIWTLGRERSYTLVFPIFAGIIGIVGSLLMFEDLFLKVFVSAFLLTYDAGCLSAFCWILRSRKPHE